MLEVGAGGLVLAFEPDVTNYRLLETNTTALDNVRLFNKALGNEAGEMSFARDETNRGDHRLSLTRTGDSAEVVRGDDVIDCMAQVVKIDTQGAEAMVVGGLMQTLARSRSDLSMIIEFWPQALEQLGSTAGELLDQLETLQLNFWIIDHEGEQLVTATGDQLRALAETIMAPETGGFMNIFATSIEGEIAVS